VETTVTKTIAVIGHFGSYIKPLENIITRLNKIKQILDFQQRVRIGLGTRGLDLTRQDECMDLWAGISFFEHNTNLQTTPSQRLSSK
jgi:hypothetical protein